MKKMLITGGTVFVSRFAAQYFSKTYDVYVLNRNTRPQCSGVTLIQGDRHNLGDILKSHHFDVVLDITAYNPEDIQDLLDALGSFDDYIFISSSAVYPETEQQPFSENTLTGPNQYWGAYGTEKAAAEALLHSRVPTAYCLRPPYLYGPGNNVYREAFVFDCARQGSPFYLPGDGSMKLQFFHVGDLCRFIEQILIVHPSQHTFNVGNPEPVTVKEWVRLCYNALGLEPAFLSVDINIEQRNYFPFYNYEYHLDTAAMSVLLPETTQLDAGIRECLAWYQENPNDVKKKPFFHYIDTNLNPESR